MTPPNGACLLVDAGNTRIKWRIVDVGAGLEGGDRGTGREGGDRGAIAGWHRANPNGTVVLADAASLAGIWRAQAATIGRALISCVAGEEIFASLATALRAATGDTPLERIVATRQRRGLTNGYRQAGQLGSDRWAAALGALALHPGRVLVVATLGTATTIDVILPAPSVALAATSPTATFLGGMILPGIELMRAALARGTAQLPLAEGGYVLLADNTDDAIVSGILHAQAGAVERACRAARAQGTAAEVLCLLGGGAAAQLAPLLAAPDFGVPVLIEHDLVLRGLASIANEDR